MGLRLLLTTMCTFLSLSVQAKQQEDSTRKPTAVPDIAPAIEALDVAKAQACIALIDRFNKGLTSLSISCDGTKLMGNTIVTANDDMPFERLQTLVMSRLRGAKLRFTNVTFSRESDGQVATLYFVR